MIEAINSVKYHAYSALNGEDNLKSADIETKTKTEEASFNIQDVLSQIKEYTYTEKDKERIDSDLVESIKEKFNVKEEDVYELYKRGVDLEKLNLTDVSYKSQAKGYGSTSENEKEQAKEKDERENATLEKKLEVIKQENDSMYLASVASNMAITINSLYENSFKGDFKQSKNQYSEKDICDVLKMNGLEINEGNKWAANLLMVHDMGVSVQSINKIQGIKSALATLEVKETGHMSGTDELMKNEQVQYEPEYVDRITDELGMVTDEHIEKLIEEGKEININELRKSIHESAKEALGQHETSGQEKPADQGIGLGEFDESKLAQAVDEVKRQILQITTKLTVEAAQKISAKMPLESSSLVSVANALSEMEQEMAKEALQQVNLPITDANIEAVTKVMDVVNNIEAQFTPTVQIEITTNETATLAEVQIALGAYEENETPVERRFGESIKTVEGQIKGLLERQGLEASPTNIEAAKALITNQMEVTEENLKSIQDIVIKLNTFLEEMTPIEAAAMIKEGVDPYNASVNQILSWMSDHKVEGLKTSVAEAIVSLEAKGQITPEQKEGMIGLYRILQSVSTQKEEVMGYLYRNQLPMTIENLQIATRYAKGKNRIEATINDDFGELEKAVNERPTAKQMIESSTTAANKTQETIRILENMQLPITEENVDRVSKMSALLYPYIKEQFKKNVGKFEGLSTLPESFLEKLQVVQNASPEMVESMLQQNIPLTLSNIYWMDKMSHNPEIYGELLNDKGMLKEGLPKDLDELEETLQKIEEEAKNQKEEATLIGDLTQYKGYKQLEEAVHFQRERIENEGLYQIPFMINGERRMVNLYVQPDDTSHGIMDEAHLKAVISYETKHLGTVKAYVEMRGENLGYRIEAEKPENHEALKAHAKTLLEGLKSIGYYVQYSAFGSEEEITQNEGVQKVKYREGNFEEIV